MDIIWPRLIGGCEPTVKPALGLDGLSDDMLKDVETAVNAHWAAMQDRIKVVDTKISSLLTQLSILSALSVVGLTASLLGDASQLPKAVVIIVSVMVFYIGIQLICSLLAVVRGLERRNFRELSRQDLTPFKEETSAAYCRRLLASRWVAMWCNDEVTNEKVGQMAVAHVALRNVLVAVGLLIVLSAGFAAYRWIIV
ncbi:MAG: hypothetical protein JW395_3296 [Nitrospira sp.]|nr:hypothetical protein [Nitrospira sp.]